MMPVDQRRHAERRGRRRTTRWATALTRTYTAISRVVGRELGAGLACVRTGRGLAVAGHRVLEVEHDAVGPAAGQLGEHVGPARGREQQAAQSAWPRVAASPGGSDGQASVGLRCIKALRRARHTSSSRWLNAWWSNVTIPAPGRDVDGRLATTFGVRVDRVADEHRNRKHDLFEAEVRDGGAVGRLQHRHPDEQSET